MADLIKFNVFGRIVIVMREASGWQAYYPGPDGKKRPADFIIPDFVTDNELEQYLDDLFHEDARPDNMTVIRLEE